MGQSPLPDRVPSRCVFPIMSPESLALSEVEWAKTSFIVIRRTIRDSSTSLGMTRRLALYVKIPRREFIIRSTAAGAALGLGIRSASLFAEKVVKPLRILILGGTGFTGPYQVHYALSRGHNITVFNRCKIHPAELPKEVEQLIGDRNGHSSRR